MKLDTTEWQQKLASLTFENIEHIYRDGLRDAIRPIYKESVLPQIIKGYSPHQGGNFLKFDGNRRELGWGTRFNGESYEGDIYINPGGALKWFEQGTVDRFRKSLSDRPNRGYTGHIQGKFIFNSIIDQSLSTVLEKALQLVDTNLQKQFDS